MRTGFPSLRAQGNHSFYFGALLLCLLLSLFSVPTKAVVINFDDLVYVPSWPDDFFGDHELTNEYEDQGLLISGGFLSVWSEGTGPSASEPNFLYAGHDLRLKFIGQLPTFVSMYVSADAEQMVFLDVFGLSGLVTSHQTDGWAGPENNTPYVPNQLVSFNVSEGISEIFIKDYYFRHTGAMIDDLTFTYAAQVPEPGSIFLFGLGLLAIFGRAYAGRSECVAQIVA